jgi:ATP:ADP antiporter, AAA family
VLTRRRISRQASNLASTKPKSTIARLAGTLSRIERDEFSATLLSFLFIFVLMTAYSILKPVRDGLGADWGAVGLSTTWTITFIASVAAVSIYGAILSITRFRSLVPGVYAFFAATFLVLYVAKEFFADPVWVNKGFYVWVSVFSLFHLSVFWGFMADLFNKSQAPRLFGIIAAGASVGSIVGPMVTIFLVDIIGTNSMLLVSADLLLVAILIIFALERLRISKLGNEEQVAQASQWQEFSKDPFAGFQILFSSKYLLIIGAFIILYATISTFVYFELQDLTKHYDINTRTKIWSSIDWLTNVLTLLTAAFVTSRIVTKLGMSTALALMPALITVGILVLVAAPTLVVLAVFQVARRVGNYAITRPSREMLYTIVDRETRFRTKPVIDIAFYRGGDMITAWLFTFLTTRLELGLAGIAIITSVVAAVWTAVALRLGRDYEQRKNQSSGTQIGETNGFA